MGTVERRQREAIRRRQAILDAARRVFREKGYAGATVPQIARAAELAPGTIYLYFPGKDALYAELLTEGYEILQQRLEEAAGAGDAAEAVGQLIDVFFEFARDYPEYFEIIFFVLQKDGDVGWQGFPEEQIARLAAWEASCRAVVAGVLAQVQFKSPERCETTVQAIWTMLAGVVFYLRGRPEFMSVAREAKAVLLAAVLGPQGR